MLVILCWLGAGGSPGLIHPPSEVLVARGLGLEAERQAALEWFGVALGYELVTGGTTLLLRALRGKQVPEARRAAHELACGGQLEALGYGLFGLLHGESGRKQRSPARLARGIL